jgi:hypothetical protein
MVATMAYRSVDKWVASSVDDSAVAMVFPMVELLGVVSAEPMVVVKVT